LEDAWQTAPTLVSLGFTPRDVAELSTHFNPVQVPQVIQWLSDTSVIYSLLDEISLGTGRISELVKALKTYSYMDQAPTQAVDIHEGLENTLVILRSKLKQGVTVHRDFAPDLPQIQAYGSELNQVWTNLIDNAVDAMGGAGDLTLRTRQEHDMVLVEITDTGQGIPEQDLPHLFDPFFTTKPIGKGTGLGLNICHNIVVQKHHGRIEVQSHPGETHFRVFLPLSLPLTENG
jgi:signal transduction histidine kinase